MERQSSWMHLLPLSGTVFRRPPFRGSKVQHLIEDKDQNGLSVGTGVDDVMGVFYYLCSDDIELELLPVVVGLLKGLDLSQNQTTDTGQNKRKQNVRQYLSKSSCAPAVF